MESESTRYDESAEEGQREKSPREYLFVNLESKESLWISIFLERASTGERTNQSLTSGNSPIST